MTQLYLERKTVLYQKLVIIMKHPFHIVHSLFKSLVVGASLLLSLHVAYGEQNVEMTWMSIANWYIKIGDTRIIMDGYVSRIPGVPFFYAPPNIPGDQYAYTQHSSPVDLHSIERVKAAVLGEHSLNYLMVGHSHWDHSWDTPTWSKLTGAPIIGGKSTCYQAQAQGVSENQCQIVNGTERITLGKGITVRVVRFNHSGNQSNPIQHFARELYKVPTPDSLGQFRAGVGEDYPNGGGNRAFLFTIDQLGSEGENNGKQKSISFFINSSASAYDLDKDIIIDGVNYGAPLDNVRAAMKDAHIDKVDAWIGTGGRAVAELMIPVLNPKIYIPHHWDGLFNSFWDGIPYPYKDDSLKQYLDARSIRLIAQKQYFDSFRLSSENITAINNHMVKAQLGFRDEQQFSKIKLDVIKNISTTSQGDNCDETQISTASAP